MGISKRLLNAAVQAVKDNKAAKEAARDNNLQVLSEMTGLTPGQLKSLSAADKRRLGIK